MTITSPSAPLSVDIAQEGFPDGSAVKNPPAVQERQEPRVRPLGQKEPLEEGAAPRSLESLPENPVGRGAWRAAVRGVAVGHGWSD